MIPSANVEKKVFKRKLERFKQAAKKKQKKGVAWDENAEMMQKNGEEEGRSERKDGDTVFGGEREETQGNEMSGGASLTTTETDEEKPNVPRQTSMIKSSILTDIPFSSLNDRVSGDTLRAVTEMGFEYMTEIQAKSIPPLLDGKDVLGSAKTGSGKTLAFLIPAIEMLLRSSWKQHLGTGILIVSPTRELSMQTYGVLYELMEKHSNISHGLVMGGANRQSESQRLSKGVSILVATPGRLLDHLQNTEGFVVRNLKCLIVDEADRIFDIGFEQEMHQIVKLLPKKRQSVLFSATCSPKVDELVKAALKTNPLKIGVTEKEKKANELATVEGLEQGYVVCPSEKRFLLLFTFLKKNRNKKIMVFFSSCSSVKYHYDLLNFIDIPVLSIHGKLKQQQRTRTFFQFCQATSGVLLCTDVAARGLDIPQVHWIVQYDPPDEPREYIHRVGRTARGDSGTGHALLILRPEELGFLRFLKAAKITLNEYEFSWQKLANIQPQLEKMVSENHGLNRSAREAYKGYIRAYDSHSLKQIYNVNTLDLIQVCKSFGFETPPFVDLPISNKPKPKIDGAKRNFAGRICNSYKKEYRASNMKMKKKNMKFKKEP